MAVLTYHGPIGEPIENPSLAFLQQIIFHTNADYWLQGGGDSCLEWEGLDERLIFFYDEPFGFFIMRHPDYLAPCREDVECRAVEHRVGGEPMRLPSCCYVSRDEAFRILRLFAEHKEIAGDVNWVDFYEIDVGDSFSH